MLLSTVSQNHANAQDSTARRFVLDTLGAVRRRRILQPEKQAESQATPASAPTRVDDETTRERGTERIITVPNLLSFLRIALVPVFLWLVIVPEADSWAIGVLVVSGITDYLDGKLARVMGQSTRLGALLDPIADRLYILAVVVGLAMRDVIPIWLAVILSLRDVLLFSLVPFLRTRGYSSLPVHFLGKAATAGLLYAFPLLLLGDGTGTIASLANVFGWAFALWGITLYWWAGVLYFFQLRQLLRTTRRVERQ